MVHERKMNPFTFEYEEVDTAVDEVAARDAAEGAKLMELLRVNRGRPGRLAEFVGRREDK